MGATLSPQPSDLYLHTSIVCMSLESEENVAGFRIYSQTGGVLSGVDGRARYIQLGWCKTAHIGGCRSSRVTLLATFEQVVVLTKFLVIVW